MVLSTAKPVAPMTYSCGGAAPPSILHRSVLHMFAWSLCLSCASKALHSTFGKSCGGDVVLLPVRWSENCLGLGAIEELLYL